MILSALLKIFLSNKKAEQFPFIPFSPTMRAPAVSRACRNDTPSEVCVNTVDNYSAFAFSATKLAWPLRSEIFPFSAMQLPAVKSAYCSFSVRGKTTTSMLSERSATLRNAMRSPFFVRMDCTFSTNPAMTVSTPLRFSFACLMVDLVC
jgi:hypothetical protein